MTAWVTDDQGQEWGTAAQISQLLGKDVHPSMVFNWSRMKKLRKVLVKDDNGRPQALFLVNQAREINKEILDNGLGRGRRLDNGQRIDQTAGKHTSAHSPVSSPAAGLSSRPGR